MFRIERSYVKFSSSPKPLPDLTELETNCARDILLDQNNNSSGTSPGNDSSDNAEESKKAAEAVLQRAREEAFREALERGQAAAEQILQKARENAEQFLRDAETRAAEIQKEAQNAGYRAGLEQADAEIERLRSEDIEAVKNTIYEIERERNRILDGLEAEVVELCLEMTKKIINLAGESDDKIFESMITKALKQIKAEGKIYIRISSAEYEKYFSSGSAFVVGERMSVAVLDDDELGAWDCIIDTENGTFNAGLDSQLKYLRIAFDGVLGT